MQNLSDYLTIYVREKINLAKVSSDQLLYSIHVYRDFLGREPTLDDLTRDQVLDWLRWMIDARRLAPATANRKRAAILCLWNHAADAGLVPPPPRLPRVHEPQRTPVAWRFDELERIFAACDHVIGTWGEMPASLGWRLGLLVFWDTGCRLGVVRDSKLSSVDLLAGTLHVPAAFIKGKKADKVFALHPQTLDVIHSSLSYPRELLWPWPRRRREVWPALKAILRDAGLPDDRTRMFHCLRRTAESYAALERGAAWAAQAVGHSEAVARASYISPTIAPGPRLIDVLPRPRVTSANSCSEQPPTQ